MPPKHQLLPQLLHRHHRALATPPKHQLLPQPLHRHHRALASMAPLEQRAVAGSFIFKYPDDNPDARPQVALFRRSAAVRTYQHKYAPIAGSVEAHDASPLATAWRELREETALTASSLRLLRQGKPYSFGDASARLALDWEHDGYAWFDPAAVTDDAAFGGVPRLLESLRRVWPEIDMGAAAARVLERGLGALRADHESGARQLAAAALAVFVDVLPRLDAASRDKWWRNVRFVAWHLWKNGRESMGAPILSVVLASLDIIAARLPPGTDALPAGFVDDAVSAIKEFAQQRQAASVRIADAFTAFLRHNIPDPSKPLTVLTLSASSTITNALTHALAERIPLHIHVLESRPLFEGAKTARALAAYARQQGLPAAVSVHTDASAGLAARGADVLLLGADLIDREGNVSNKTGSLPAVLAARHVSPAVKVVALADTEKILPFDPPGHEENDPAEVSGSWGGVQQEGDVAVENVYFEWVSAGLIDHYVTEDGVTTAEGVAAGAEDVQRRADRFFSDL
ncbi:Methylthioribose-1-phosphate isomerase [Tolypocladium ophioglossoides CBS 100239]|uniref:Methylthioribose-1-phosphate isomerase n=1 Tax=Tolypocladium ophioglossoides (strain CBS 100239) TaxID=1163406 RepID=A0A0L0NF03_TOLOC|nr:Methylthioribose-1-phosphate isomerase [Tolypocladium ophioglossoides CBS 100239]